MAKIREGSPNITDFVSNSKRGTNLMQKGEELFIGTAESEHVEMYLKAIWYLHEKGQDAKVSSIAKLLNVTQPSVVQMLRKLHNSNLVNYGQTQVTLTEGGRKIGKQMIRNTRLLEVMMKDALRIEIDEEMVCGIEHHMKTIFTDALCTLLKHPRKCPHGHDIPKGKCCP
ncbi:MAG TPA: metal-dependent transcriptional regulator [Nitrososphaera sp.]|jgi:DtxR family Mn-dependent transcriptional regulator|nr:metal-dependent transcriptional regulator [Nitrososphaera sp.]